MSEEKWTKEQIEMAREIINNHGCGTWDSSCGKCLLDDKNKKDFCLLSYPSNERYAEKPERFDNILAQHEHDADEPETIPDKCETKTGQSVHDYWRYMFAGMAMQEIINDDIQDIDGNTTLAVKYADALLEKLEGKNAGK